MFERAHGWEVERRRTVVAQQLMKVEEVGTLAKLHPEVVRRAIRRGELEAVRLGRRLRVSEASYEAWIFRNKIDIESYS